MSHIQRALELRNQIHIAISLKQITMPDNALGNLESALLWLMGVINASVRVAHYVLNLNPSKAYKVEWQKYSWLEEVRKKCPVLNGAIANNTDGQRTLAILSKLRNSIHGEADSRHNKTR